MRKLLSLPPNAVKDYYKLNNRNSEDWFCTSDPRDMRLAPESMHTLVVSGDVYIHTDKPLQVIPEADVVCYGLWLLSDRGVALLRERSYGDGDGLRFYDMYSEFGLAL